MKGNIIIAALVIGTVLAGCASIDLVSLEKTVEGPRQVRQGQDINPEDIMVWGIYGDAGRKQVNLNSSNIVFNKHTPGPQTVRIRVSNKEVSFQTEVMPLCTLAVASQPSTITFRQGQEAPTTWPGLEIRGEWDSMGSDRIDFASCTFSGYNKDQSGRQAIMVSFEGATTAFNVEVRSLTSIKIAQPPLKLTYGPGESLNLTGLSVVGVWEGLPEQEIAITTNDVTGFNAAMAGTQTLTVTKDGRTATFNVEVVLPDPALNGS